MVTAFVAAVLAGVWAGRLAAPPPQLSPVASRSVTAGPAELGVPASWRSATLSEAGMHGLDRTRSTAFAPAPGRASWAIITVAPADHPSLISRRLRRLLGGSVLHARTTRLGGRPAWGYAPMRTRSGDRVVELTVQPTTRGVLTVACVSPAKRTTAPGCASDISSTSVQGADTLVPSPSLALALQLPDRLDALDRARLAARAALRRADSPREQVRLAQHLADAHRVAAKALRPVAGTADTSLVDALEAAGFAYASLAGAAAEGPAAAFVAARRDVTSADSRLERAINSLVPRITPEVARREAVSSAAAAADSRSAEMPSPLFLLLALAGFGAAGLLARTPRVSAGDARAVASPHALAWAGRRRRGAARSRRPRPRSLAIRSAKADLVRLATRRIADRRPAMTPSATASPVQPLRRSRLGEAPVAAPPARTPIRPPTLPSPAGAVTPSSLSRTRASAPPAGDQRLDSHEPADARPPAPEQPAGEPARGGWTCEIGWRAGLRSAAFKAVAAAPGEERRLIAESPAVEWPPLMRPEPTGELDVALRTLERRLTERGWTLVAGGPEWYRRRFSWAGAEAPEQLGTVQLAESGWSCEIVWKAGLRGADFRAVARAAGEGEHVVARSPKLEWPPFIPPQPDPELVAAATAVEGMLVEAGWRPAGRGPSWYARRFEWGLDGTPEPLDGRS